MIQTIVSEVYGRVAKRRSGHTEHCVTVRKIQTGKTDVSETFVFQDEAEAQQFRIKAHPVLSGLSDAYASVTEQPEWRQPKGARKLHAFLPGDDMSACGCYADDEEFIDPKPTAQCCRACDKEINHG